MTAVQVLKLDLEGQVTWQYSGQIVRQTERGVELEAFFDREDADLHGMHLGRGDRFIEHFYTDRWYNIFEIHAHQGDTLRGWYCNIGYPAKVEPGQISYVDLALDLLVFPDGRQLVLDEDEFAALPLSGEQRQQALTALSTLQTAFLQGTAFQLD